MAKQNEDSLRKRYFFKAGGGLLGMPINLAVQTLVLRSLGPMGYGSYSFLTGVFADVISFFESGTTIAFYNKLCQRPNERTLVGFYWRFVGVVALFICMGAGGIMLSGLGDRIWPGQLRLCVWLAVAFAIGTWALGMAEKIVDAYGLTTSGETARFLQKCAGLCLIILCVGAGALDLTVYFVIQCLLVLLLVGLWQAVLVRGGHSLGSCSSISFSLAKKYALEFWSYSHPLIVYTAIGMATSVADRWLLQTFGGSVEQGFYGLSYQVGIVCFLLTGAMAPLLAREFSKAFADGDLHRMRQQFERQIPRFYAVSAFFGIFLATQADRVAVLLGGDLYRKAWLPVMLMSCYPIHQTYGQLSGSLFFATGQTRLYRNIGVSGMLLGLIVSFWLLAPRAVGGLNLGATGLAIKMVAVQLIGVNIQLWFNSRYLDLPFRRFLGQQVVVVLTLGVFAVTARLLSNWIMATPIPGLFASGILYTLGGVGWAWVFAPMLGVRREDLGKQLSAGMRRLRVLI